VTTPIASVRIAVEADIARVRQISDFVAQSLGLESFARTRLVTAVLEIARNALQYAGGGQAKFSAGQISGRSYLTVKVIDQGSGLQDEAMMAPARRPYLPGTGASPGGLGLGLRGVKRLADRFAIASSGEGTRVDMGFVVPVEPTLLAGRAEAIAGEIAGISIADPVTELARQNRELAEAMAERELLIDEVHHRTGNNLALIVSFIQMSKRSARLEETRQALAELEARVHSVAQVHQELQRTRQADRIALLPFLEKVAQHAKAAFSTDERQITIAVDGQPAEVASNAAVDLGLIVGELITNAIKHAFPHRQEGRIDITFARADPQDETSGWVVSVRDDGVGYSAEERPGRPQSLGWRMIRAMAARHGGTISTEGDSGFHVQIVFPTELIEQAE